MSRRTPGSTPTGDVRARLRFAIAIEAKENYSAQVSDLPECIAAGDSMESTKDRIREATALHLLGMRDDGLPMPRAQILVEGEVGPSAVKRSLIPASDGEGTERRLIPPKPYWRLATGSVSRAASSSTAWRSRFLGGRGT